MSNKRKYLLRDVRPQDQPEETYPFGKNGLQNNIKGAIENEPGFRQSAAVIPYKYCGVIETPKLPVIFSSNGVNSAFGYFDPVNDLYLPIFDDATASFKLGLDPANYVTGQAQLNYKGEVVIAFTDKNTFPKFANCDNPNINTLNDLRLFPLSNLPDMDITQDSGGALLPGAYYVAVKYSKNDGTETAYLTISDVQIVTGEQDQVTDRSVSIKLTNCDPDFDQVIVAIISKIKGVTKAVELQPIPIGSSGEVHTIYTGGNFSTDIDIEEILVDPTVYSKVQTMGQLNDALYLAGLEKEPDINMQKHALLVKIEWVSSLEGVNPPSQDVLSGKKRGFMHEEVIAVYIQYSLTTGGWTKAYYVPGPASFGTASDPSTEAATEGITAKNYQVTDTIPAFNASQFTGTCGVWINQNENLPDTADYDATSIGGVNLRNQPVQHHRMPSIRWCKENLYPYEPAYGRDKLDILGIKASNIIIPTEYAGRINGYRILYARRSLSNSTVIGQSLLMHGGRAGRAATGTITGPDDNYLSTGGNWHSRKGTDSSSGNQGIVIDRNLFRFHGFDILFNKPAIVPSYMSLLLRHQKDNINNPLIEDFSVAPGEKNGPIVFLVDYLAGGNTPTAAASGKRIRKVSETQYVPNGIPSGKWQNTDMETTFGGKISNPVLDTGDIQVTELYTGSHSFEPPEDAASKEVSYLCNLMTLRSDCYLPFNSQSLVVAGSHKGFDSIVFFGGDVFINDYCFHTYGWHDIYNNSYGFATGIGGIKAARRFACEAASNINARFQLPGNEYSKWYPKFPLKPQDATDYLTNLKTSIDPNQFGYNKDLNTLNDLVTAAIFNPTVESITDFPFRIHRGGKLSRQTKIRSWRTFLPLDYYEMQKNMGKPLHLEGMDDRLLIHCENALFYTQDKAKLEGGLLSVTLGSGDIFQFEPQEAMSAKLGYAGSQHDLACVRTPAGYVFIDSKMGQVFIYKGGLKLMNEGLNTFFRDFLRLKDQNVFIGNGYTIGYDSDYKRILVTAKNLSKSTTLTGKLWYAFEETPEFMAGLTVGDLVYKDGRWLKFLGINSTSYSCPADVIPTLNDATFSLNENSPFGTLVGTLSGINIQNAYIIAGNLSGAFYLDPTTLQLKVNNQAMIDFETHPLFTLTVRGYSSDGHTDDATITVNLNDIAEPPVTGNFDFSIPENTANATVVGTVVATDPNSLPLTFAITGGNSLGIFTINGSTGVISIANNTNLDFELYQQHILTVSVGNGTFSVNSTVTIHVTNVNEPPDEADTAINIFDTTPDNTVVFKCAATDPDQGQTLSYQLLTASVPGVFTVNSDGTVVMNTNSALNALTTPQYTLTILVRDSGDPSLTKTFTLTINVLYDPGTLEFHAGSASCFGTTKTWVINVFFVYSTRLATDVATITMGTTFQGIVTPNYAPVANSIDCGGTVQMYVNATQSGVAVKNDCTTGAGTAVTYYVPKGLYVSLISQADADSQAMADVTANKQAYANTHGLCL